MLFAVPVCMDGNMGWSWQDPDDAPTLHFELRGEAEQAESQAKQGLCYTYAGRIQDKRGIHDYYNMKR